MAKQPKDIAASVRQRLLNLARAEGQLFDVVLVAFGLERLVYRLSVSGYRDRFVLKGGMLVTLWTADTGRFTRDIDFLAFGSDEEAELKTAFSQILAIDGDDGLVYDIESLTAVAIREDQIYGGMRLRTEARLGNTRIPITVDLGFGDALADPQFEIEYRLPARLSSRIDPRLFTGNGHRREVSGRGGAGLGEQPDEGSLRSVDAAEVRQHRHGRPHGRDPRNLRSTRYDCSSLLPCRPVGGVLDRSGEDDAVAGLLWGHGSRGTAARGGHCGDLGLA